MSLLRILCLRCACALCFGLRLSQAVKCSPGRHNTKQGACEGGIGYGGGCCLAWCRLEMEVRRDLAAGRLPSVQPFHAMAYPFPAELALQISTKYAGAPLLVHWPRHSRFRLPCCRFRDLSCPRAYMVSAAAVTLMHTEPRMQEGLSRYVSAAVWHAAVAKRPPSCLPPRSQTSAPRWPPGWRCRR
jgi:hypothetical protein